MVINQLEREKSSKYIRLKKFLSLSFKTDTNANPFSELWVGTSVCEEQRTEHRRRDTYNGETELSTGNGAEDRAQASGHLQRGDRT